MVYLYVHIIRTQRYFSQSAIFCGILTWQNLSNMDDRRLNEHLLGSGSIKCATLSTHKRGSSGSRISTRVTSSWSEEVSHAECACMWGNGTPRQAGFAICPCRALWFPSVIQTNVRLWARDELWQSCCRYSRLLVTLSYSELRDHFKTAKNPISPVR